MATNNAATSMSYSAAMYAARKRSPVTWCRTFTASTWVQSSTTTLG
jgi:hypothetical protein